MTISALFNVKVNLLKRSKTKNPAGGFIEVWVPYATDVRCRICSFKPKDTQRLEEEKQKSLPTHQVFFPPSVDIAFDYRIEYVNKQSVTKIYEVKDVRDPSEMAHHIEVFCRILPAAEIAATRPV